MPAEILRFREFEEAVWREINLSETLASIESQHTYPVMIETTKIEEIAGFQLTDIVTEESEVSTSKRDGLHKRKQLLMEYLEEASKLREKLRGIGIIPIAILPSKIWRYLCNESGLYLFEHMDKNGRVPCKKIKLLNWALIQKNILCRALWPEKDDCNGFLEDKVKIRFPDPPHNVAAVLRKLAQNNFKINVAAVSDAINIEGREFSPEKSDPIIYVGKCTSHTDSLVAVIAQFGDFPIEQEVIDKIRIATFLPQ